MKALLGILIAVLTVLGAEAENTIPNDLVGVWADKTGGAFLMLRSDGLTIMGGSIGMTGLATFEQKDSTLTATFRNETGDVLGKILLRYDPQSHKLAGLKAINYLDPENPKVKAPKPREEPYPYTFERISAKLDEPIQSMDLQKALKLH